MLLAASFLAGFKSVDNSWQEITVADYDKIVDVAESFFKQTTCTVEYKMESFKTHTDKNAHDAQFGKAIISGKNMYSNFLGIKTIQNKNYRIVIDSVDKTILIANPVNVTEYKPLIENYKVFKKYFASIKKLNTVEGFKLELNFKEKLKIKKIMLDVNKDGFIKKTSSYLNVAISENPANEKAPKSKPRIETSFLSYKKNVTIDYKKYFDEAIYFIVKNGKMTPNGNYKNYTISDTRIKQ